MRVRGRFLVRGRVQGVGYRWFVRRAAMALGLAGLVRNLADGTVEVLVEGESEGVHELGVLLGKGPALASVEGVERDDLPHEVELPNPFETG